MRPMSISTGLGLIAMCLVGLTGCSKTKTKTNAPSSGQAAVTAHHHHHGSSRGLHGGFIIGLDIENYHAELTHDDKTKRVGIYVLGEDAATAAPIEAKSVTFNATIDDKPTEYTLPAVVQPGDPAGKSSYFELVSEPLLAIVTDKSGSPNPDVQLTISIEGKPHTGDVDVEHMSEPAVGQGNAANDALTWSKELKEQGYDISLGYHGSALLAGSKVEPAVQITREGKPVADAKVFNALLEANGKAVLATEVATVYEPPSSDEPSHYAQGALKIPPGTREAVLRYRIVLPEGKGERTYDVPVAVK
jgi:hypothetical protein